MRLLSILPQLFVLWLWSKLGHFQSLLLKIATELRTLLSAPIGILISLPIGIFA